jgi:8-oxo-dGTP diphosphatase
MRTNLRVGAIFLHDGKILIVRMIKGTSTYCVLPGGGVEHDETIEDALKREVLEETNLTIRKARLVYIRELDVKDKGRGIEFYFLVEAYDGLPRKGFDPETKDSSLVNLELIDITSLKDVVFHPEQLICRIGDDLRQGFPGVTHLGLHSYP